MTTTYLKVLRNLFSLFYLGSPEEANLGTPGNYSPGFFFKQSLWPIEYLRSRTRQG